MDTAKNKEELNMQDITPEDSVATIYLLPMTNEQKKELEELDAKSKAESELKKQAKASLVSKLAGLGLTEDEIAAL